VDQYEAAFSFITYASGQASAGLIVIAGILKKYSQFFYPH